MNKLRQLSNYQQGTLYAIGSGLCFGLLGYFGITIVQSGLSVFTMLFLRFLVATVFMFIIAWPHRAMISINTRECVKVFLYGMTFYSGSAITYFFASVYIGTGLAMVIFFAYPAMVMILNKMLYRTPISTRSFIAFIAIAIGMVLLVDTHEFKFDLAGIGLSLLSALTYALYVIASKKSNLNPQVSTLMVSAGCMVTCLCAALIQGGFQLPLTLSAWGNVIALGIICTALPILLLLKALSYISSEQASFLAVLEPIFVVIVGVALLGETIHATQIAGIVVILLGALATL